MLGHEAREHIVKGPVVHSKVSHAFGRIDIRSVGTVVMTPLLGCVGFGDDDDWSLDSACGLLLCNLYKMLYSAERCIEGISTMSRKRKTGSARSQAPS